VPHRGRFSVGVLAFATAAGCAQAADLGYPLPIMARDEAVTLHDVRRKRVTAGERL
jgi:hypothetical protein